MKTVLSSLTVVAICLTSATSAQAYNRHDAMREAYNRAVDRAAERMAERRELRRQQLKEARQDYRTLAKTYRDTRQERHEHSLSASANIGGLQVGAGVSYR
jgi:uncharacterized membrane protein